MLKTLNTQSVKFSALLTTGLIYAGAADAATLKAASTKGLKDMTANFITNTLNLPGLISIVAYMAGLALGVLGILKLKDHVENPSQTPLKDGAVRLGAGGALLALPFLYEVIIDNLTEGQTGQASQVIQLQGLTTDRTVGK